MSDLISRQAVIEAIERDAYRHTYLDQILDIIKSMPSAQPERKTGKWIETDSHEPCWFKCDQCGRLSDIKEIYCPTCGASMVNTTCGADMRGEQDGRFNQQTGGD